MRHLVTGRPASHRPDGSPRRRRGGAGPARRGPLAGRPPGGRPAPRRPRGSLRVTVVRTLDVVSNLERRPAETLTGAVPQPRSGRRVLEPREVPLGGPRAMVVRRTLPHRELPTIGAWCFLDDYGPHDVTGTAGMQVPPHPAHRAADRDLAARRRGPPPGQPGQRRPRPARRAQPDDRRPRHQPRRDLPAGRDRHRARPAAVGRAAGSRPRHRARLRSPPRPAGGRGRRPLGHRPARLGGRCHVAGAHVHTDRRRGRPAAARWPGRAPGRAGLRARSAGALRRARGRRAAAAPRRRWSTSRRAARRWWCRRGRPAAA